MAIRYSDVPQLQYGRQRPDNWRERFPPEAQPVANAPKNTSDPFVVWEPSGEPSFSLRDSKGFKKGSYERNEYTGAYEFKLTDEYISQPVMWAPYKPQR
jgi:hypothetical protein